MKPMCKNVETRVTVSRSRSRPHSRSTHDRYAQELRVRVRVDMPPGLHVQELAEVLCVHQVAVDAHGEPKGRVDVKWLRLRPVFSFLLVILKSTALGVPRTQMMSPPLGISSDQHRTSPAADRGVVLRQRPWRPYHFPCIGRPCRPGKL